MRKYLALALLFLAASLVGVGAAAAAWPDRPVKVIVGFTPGGPTDLVARLVAQQLTARPARISSSRTSPAPAAMSAR